MAHGVRGKGAATAAVAALFTALWMSCGDGSSGNDATTGPGGGGAGGGGAKPDAAGGTGFDVAVEPCPAHCSKDLTKVLGCQDEVLEECGGDQACAGGTCIDACDATVVNKSSYGCEYYAVTQSIVEPFDPFNPGMKVPPGPCFAAVVANTWSTPVRLAVERNGVELPVASFVAIPSGEGAAIAYTPYDDALGLPPGEVAILFLSRPADGLFPECPYGPSVVEQTWIDGPGLGEAFRITTDRPVVAYQILPYGGGDSALTSATLLLPTSAWGTNYVALDAYEETADNHGGVPTIALVAAHDGTEITIDPVADIESGGGVFGTPKGVMKSYLLDRGEVLQFAQPAELSGSIVQSNKPVGLLGGSSCMNVPRTRAFCDTAQQQIPPVNALGHEYVGVRYKGRNGLDESPPWRLVGAANGTTLVWEPAPPPGAPGSVELGQVVEFYAPGPFVVRSQDAQHPFHLSLYMTGSGLTGTDDSVFGGQGDPEWLPMIPPDQYLSRYVFFTDPTYPETSLVVVRTSKNGAFADVTLDCAGVIGGWTPIGDYEFTIVTTVAGNFEGVGGCSNGRREMSSDLPFGVSVWGWGSVASVGFKSTDVSYAYPAGASVSPINDVEILPTPN